MIMSLDVCSLHFPYMVPLCFFSLDSWLATIWHIFMLFRFSSFLPCLAVDFPIAMPMLFHPCVCSVYFFSLPSRLRAPIGVSPTHRIFFLGEGGGHLCLRQLLLAKVFSTRSHCFITGIAIEFITYVWSCGIWINWDDYVSEYLFAWFRIYGAPLFFPLDC